MKKKTLYCVSDLRRTEKKTYNKLSLVETPGFVVVALPLDLTEEPELGGGGNNGTKPLPEDPVAGRGREGAGCPSGPFF